MLLVIHLYTDDGGTRKFSKAIFQKKSKFFAQIKIFHNFLQQVTY